jgi:hypothetical protein
VAFLPLTTLLYAVLWEPGGLEGWEWFWIALAVILDLTHWDATQASARRPCAFAPVRPIWPPEASALDGWRTDEGGGPAAGEYRVPPPGVRAGEAGSHSPITQRG